MKSKATKIIRLEAENVKRLKAVDIRPDGALVVVKGRNAQGKSSVLDAIWMALGGKRAFPRRPVREGAEEATIRLDLNGIIVERRIKPDGQTSLVVSNDDGARYPSPQAMLDALVGSLSFDPLEFARMEPKRQRLLLRELVGLDTSELEVRRARHFDERTSVSREVRRLEGEISGVPHHPDAPSEEVSVAELAGELRGAEEAHRALERAETAVREQARVLGEAETHASGLERELVELEAQVARVRERLEEGRGRVIPARRAALETVRAQLDDLRAEAPDREAIASRLAGAETTNQLVRTNRRREELKAQHASTALERDKLTAAIEACDREMAELVAGASYPLEGLGVDELGVTLHGLPFEQASSAEQLRASVAIGLALHPSLRVLLVRDGSLLDSDSMAVLAELAAEADAQVWLERVGVGGAVGVIIEDGAVAEPAQTAVA